MEGAGRSCASGPAIFSGLWVCVVGLGMAARTPFACGTTQGERVVDVRFFDVGCLFADVRGKELVE